MSLNSPDPSDIFMEAFFVSTLAVAISEVGDKTQLLALVLAARFRKPLPIISGIFAATLLNHALAALLGSWVADNVDADVLRYILAGSFIAVGLWALKADSFDKELPATTTYGAFLVTLAAFFIAEIGDKTQVATMMMAAKFDDLTMVVIGTTLGMMLANVPVVFCGNFAAEKLPVKYFRYAASALFIILGVVTLFAAGVI